MLAATTGIAYAAGRTRASLIALPTGKMPAACLRCITRPQWTQCTSGMPVFLEHVCDAQHEQMVHGSGKGLDVRPRPDGEVRKR